jgi:hypothetical protein
MSIVWKVAATVLALLAIVGTVKAVTGGGDSDSDYREVTIGETEVLIPSYLTREETIPVTIQRYLAKLGFVASYRRCVAREVGRAVSPAYLEDAEELSTVSLRRKGIDLIAEANPKCIEPGRAILDPDATPKQLAAVREGLAAAIPAELAGLDFTTEETECAAERIGQISDAEVLAVQNDGPRRAEVIYAEAMEPCFN